MHAFSRNPSNSLKSPSHKGAALIAKKAHLEDCLSKMHIVSYIRAHHESWLDFAASGSWNLTLQDEDIIFVSGTTMTTKWAMAAYEGQYDSHGWAEEHVQDLFDHHDAKSDVDIRHTTQPRPPHDPGADAESHHGPESDARDPDQCLFIHYYQVKRRMWKQPVPTVLEAAAGPHHIVRGPNDDPPEGGNPQNITGAEEPMSHIEDLTAARVQSNSSVMLVRTGLMY